MDLRPYEGMFLCANKDASKDLKYLEDHVKHLIDRAGGEVITSRKWDDRKLAYEIERQTHGIYYLVYFQGESETVSKLNREVELSEFVLRGLFLQVVEVPEAELNRTKEDDDPESADASKSDGTASDNSTGLPVVAAGEPVVAAAGEPVVAAGAGESSDSSEASGDDGDKKAE